MFKSILKNKIKFPAKIINFYTIKTGKILKNILLEAVWRSTGGQMKAKFNSNVKIEILTHKNLYFDTNDHSLEITS